LLRGSGKISVSRSLGDAHYGTAIKHTPDTSMIESSCTRVLMVATDGVLRGETMPDVIQMTRNLAFNDGWRMRAIAVEIVRIFARRTGDNATVVLAHLPAIE
jgi:serine/threonine protein phosphatase PrpC